MCGGNLGTTERKMGKGLENDGERWSRGRLR